MSTSPSFSQSNGCERSPWGIAWSCLVVVIACAWKAVHLDVPAPTSTSWRWWRRARMTLWTIFVPEFVIRRAIIQRYNAQQVSETWHKGDTESNRLGDVVKSKSESNLPQTRCPQCVRYNPFAHGNESRNEAPWTQVHSFFLLMGGFATRCENDQHHTVRFEHLKGQSHMNWPTVDVVEINDKSNGDFFTKLIVVWQTAWFVIQLVTRLVEGLAITELEIMTLAYALSCALLYALWWDKPYDVQTPILIRDSTANPAPDSRRKLIDPSLLVFQCVLSRDWIMDLDSIIFEGADKGVPKRERTICETAIIRVLFVASATIFGCIHCIPWNFRFPTTLERTMWLASAAIIAGAPPIMGCMLALIELSIAQLRTYDEASSHPRHFIICNVILAMITMILQFFHLILVFAYCLARLILLTQAFVLLRNLSPSAAQSITWSRLIPHV